MAFVHHKFGKTFYQSFGKKNSKHLPLVCLHGGPGGTHYSFLPLKELGRKRLVVLYDQIGSGRSSPLKAKDRTIPVLVNDLRALLKKLKIKRFHLLGTSWGGTLALEYYFQTKGEGVESLILQSPLVSTKLWERDCKKLLKTLPRKNQKVIKTCLSIGATDSKVYAKAEAPFYKKYCYRGKPDPRRARYLKKFPNPHGGEVYLQMWGPSEYTCLGTLKKYDALPRLKRIKVPTKIICGQFDEARPNTLRDISKKIENSSFTIIPKASHAILAEQPAKMRKSVETFLRGLEK